MTPSWLSGRAEPALPRDGSQRPRPADSPPPYVGSATHQFGSPPPAAFGRTGSSSTASLRSRAMGQWSRAELEEAFHNYEQTVVEIGTTWDWASYADHFT